MVLYCFKVGGVYLRNLFKDDVCRCACLSEFICVLYVHVFHISPLYNLPL